MFQFLRKVKGEMAHTVWPTKKQTMWHTLFVVIISFIVAYYLGLFDYIFVQLLGKII